MNFFYFLSCFLVIVFEVQADGPFFHRYSRYNRGRGYAPQSYHPISYAVPHHGSGYKSSSSSSSSSEEKHHHSKRRGCYFETGSGAVASLSYNLKCKIHKCLLKGHSTATGLLNCDKNEVAISTSGGDHCVTLSSRTVSLQCNYKHVSVQIETHQFDGLDRWNSQNITTLSNVKSISCGSCDDPCVFGYAMLTEPDVDSVFPTSSLCSLRSNAMDLASDDLSYVCKVASGTSTTIATCPGMIDIQTSTLTMDDQGTSLTFTCNNGVLTSTDGTIADVVAVVCNAA